MIKLSKMNTFPNLFPNQFINTGKFKLSNFLNCEDKIQGDSHPNSI